MTIGDLCQSNWHWILFPTKKLLEDSRRINQNHVNVFAFINSAREEAKFWSIELNSNVTVLEKKTTVVITDIQQNDYKVLGINGQIGWVDLTLYSPFFRQIQLNK